MTDPIADFITRTSTLCQPNTPRRGRSGFESQEAEMTKILKEKVHPGLQVRTDDSKRIFIKIAPVTIL